MLHTCVKSRPAFQLVFLACSSCSDHFKGCSFLAPLLFLSSLFQMLPPISPSAVGCFSIIRLLLQSRLKSGTQEQKRPDLSFTLGLHWVLLKATKTCGFRHGGCGFLSLISSRLSLCLGIRPHSSYLADAPAAEALWFPWQPAANQGCQACCWGDQPASSHCLIF